MLVVKKGEESGDMQVPVILHISQVEYHSHRRTVMRQQILHVTMKLKKLSYESQG